MGRQWTQAQKVAQSQKIRQWKPWQHATGAKTTQGKAAVSRNAYKGGVRPTMRNIAKLLHQQKQMIDKMNP